MYGCSWASITDKSAKQSWKELRKAYIARTNEYTIGSELGLYTTKNYEAEVQALNTSNKLSTVLDVYIDNKFGELLDASGSDEVMITEEMQAKLDATNRMSGLPIFLTEMSQALKVATDIYKLQKSIFENAPKNDIEYLEAKTEKPKFKSDKERNQAIARLKAKLSDTLENDKNTIIDTNIVES